MSNFKESRSVFDSLAELYEFLDAKYTEELRKYSKREKKNKRYSEKKSIEPQKESNNAKITTDIIYNINKNKNSQSKVNRKVYNINTMKLQTQKKKKNLNPPIDYDPIPFNFLSTNYKNEKIQVGTENEVYFQTKKQNYVNNLRENYELVNYLANNKIKSDAFSLWTKKFYYSIMKKRAVKINGFHFEENQFILNQANCTQNNSFYQENEINQRPQFIFDSSESTYESEVISNSNTANKNLTNNNKSSNNNLIPEKDEKDMYVDIVLSEYNYKE